MTQSTFLRLASNQALFREDGLSLPEAWARWDVLMEDERFPDRLEPLGLEHMWRRLTIGSSYSPKVWNDRYLAAFAIADSLTFVTFDRAFAAVPGLAAKILGEK